MQRIAYSKMEIIIFILLYQCISAYDQKRKSHNLIYRNRELDDLSF